MNLKYSTKKNEKGQGLVEYVLILVFVGIVLIGALAVFGDEVKNTTSIFMGSFGYSLHEGVLIIPGLGPSLTPIVSSTPLATSTPTPLHGSTTIATSTPLATSTPTATATPTTSPTPTVIPIGTWITCANENGFCSFSGTAQVRYGANDIWVIQTHTDGVACTNAVFGDPVWGVVKTCQVYQIATSTPTASPTPTATSTPTATPTSTVTPVGTWITCANENGFCSFSGTAQVRYGANDIWVTQTRTDGVACTNAVFGDPVVGVVKTCQIYQIASPTPTP